MTMAEPADINVDELRRRARRRLVGAVVLALGVAVVVPMLLETEQKPLGEDVSVKIPPIDEGKFVNRLNETRAKEAPKGAAKADGHDGAEPAKPATSSAAATSPAAPAERTTKYDTNVPDNASGSVSTTPNAPVTEPAAPKPASDAGAADSSVSAPAPAAGDAPSKSVVSPVLPAPAPVAPDTASAATAQQAAAGAARAPANPPAHDGYAVQLAAFADDKGATALAGRLKKAGYAAYTEPLKTSKGTLWRVRVGPYPSRESAVAARDKLKSEGQSGIVAAVK